MKKVLFTFLIFLIVGIAHSQTTYYWVGGTSGSFSASSSWNTALNGSGSQRVAFNSSDILIFDGTNIGGSTPITGTVTPDITGSTSNIGQLRLINGAIVVLRRNASGGSTYTIMGDATSTDDFSIDATSSLTIGATVAGQGFTLQMGSTTNNTLTGKILGTLRIDDGGFASTNARLIDSCGAGSLVFANGSNLFYNNRTTTTSNYGFTGSVTRSIKFESGSNFVYQGTARIHEATHFPLQFDKGSNFILEAYPSSASSNTIMGNRVFSNVIVRNNAQVTLTDNPLNIDDLTINSGSTFLIRTSNSTPVAGNIINNGTFGSAPSPTSSVLLMHGTSPQTISGSGTFNALGSFHVANGADVTLGTNLTIIGSSTSSITGKLNTQNFTIGGTGSFQLRPAASITSNCTTTQDGHIILVDPSIYNGSVNNANVASGALVTGPGIQPNTFVIATSSNNSNFTISKPALVTSNSLGAALTITNTPATLTTSHPNGVDGTIITSGTRNFATGSNYIFNAATTTPFGLSTNNAAGNITFNAPATTNKTQNITGVLTLNNGNLTLRPTDTLIIQSTGSIAGTNSSKYIALQNNTTSVGVLRMNGITSAKLFPVGTINNYLPVTLTPTTIDTLAVSVFEGATVDGTPGGTAMNPTQKARIVDAIWTINRISPNADACGITTNWTTNLDGSLFINYANNEIGLSRYTGTAWTPAAGTGDNIANTATNNTFTSFGAFGVGKVGVTLPVKISSFNAIQEEGKIKLTWNVSSEINVSKYSIEKSTDGINFNTILTVNANNNQKYTGYDFAPASINYYRIKVLDNNNSISYSSIVKIKTSSTKAELVVYPNPVVNNQFSIQLSNLAKGKTDVVIYNNIGQQVFNKSILSEAGSQTQYISLPTSIAKGLYKLIITNNETKLQQTLLMQ